MDFFENGNGLNEQCFIGIINSEHPVDGINRVFSKERVLVMQDVPSSLRVSSFVPLLTPLLSLLPIVLLMVCKADCSSTLRTRHLTESGSVLSPSIMSQGPSLSTMEHYRVRVYIEWNIIELEFIYRMEHYRIRVYIEWNIIKLELI